MDPKQRYKSKIDGDQIDVALERALPGGTIDLSLSNKVDKACALPSGTDLNNVTDPNEYACEFDDLYLNFPVVTNAYSLSVHKTTSYALYQVFRPFHIDAIYFRRKYSDGWHDWLQIATATPPTEYDLPLASGITPDPSAQNVYSKDQFGIVRVEIGTLGSIAAGGTIGTLPSGSCPAKSIYRQCFIVTASGFSATLVVVGTDGSIKIAGWADAATNGVHGTFDFIAASQDAKTHLTKGGMDYGL